MERDLVFQRLFALTLIFSSLNAAAYAQYEGKHSASFESLISSDEELPFWLGHNASGKYGGPSKAVQLLEVQSHNRINRVFNKAIDLEFGVSFVAPYASNSDVHFNELYGGIHFWNAIKLEAGMFREESYLDGLSSTNMNLDRTLNARPYPKMRLATDGFINPFFSDKWFSFKAEYDEGLLDDDRVPDGTHLHHKSLYMKFRLKGETYLTAAMNHYVMWGGTHPIYGRLPGFEDYWRYILGLSGDDNFLEGDRINAAGNQFGSYHLQLDISKRAYDLTFYLDHPFEDRSGMNGHNWRDNLIGVFVHRKKEGFLEKALYEFMYTKNQSGPLNNSTNSIGQDNYYNHGIYSSGYTYRGYTLCSPLFAPLRIENGIVTYIQNNRIAMHHLGFMGSAGNHMDWDARLTYSNNLGTYSVPYDPPKNQFSSLLQLRYFGPKLPVELSISLAADLGRLYPNRFGARISISKPF